MRLPWWRQGPHGWWKHRHFLASLSPPTKRSTISGILRRKGWQPPRARLPGMRKRKESEYPVAVFDIGGTWFRSAVLMPDGKLLHLSKLPAINYLCFPADAPQVLQARLADFLLQEVSRFSHVMGFPLLSAAISLGAALNARTGLVLNSGPLWGPDSGEFDLLAALRRRDSQTSWHLWNDITANLLYHATASGFEQHAKISLITVSTGIGMRTC